MIHPEMHDLQRSIIKYIIILRFVETHLIAVCQSEMDYLLPSTCKSPDDLINVSGTEIKWNEMNRALGQLCAHAD